MNNAPNENISSFRGYVIMVLAVFTWSFSEVIVKLLQGSVGPLSLSFFRYLIGGLFLLLILIFKRDFSDIIKLIKNNWKLLLISSSFALGIANILYFIGITNTQANVASVIYTTYSIWITIYSIFILNERTNLKLKFVGIFVGMFGVLILMTNFNIYGLFATENLLGNGLVLLGSLIWGLYSVLGKRIQLNEKKISNIALKYTMLSNFLAIPPIFIILIFSPEFNSLFFYGAQSWFWIFFLGIVSTGLGTFLLFEGIKHIEASKGMSLAFFKPIFTTFLAYLLLKELPTINLIISIIFIIIAISLINRNPHVENNKTF